MDVEKKRLLLWKITKKNCRRRRCIACLQTIYKMFIHYSHGFTTFITIVCYHIANEPKGR